MNVSNEKVWAIYWNDASHPNNERNVLVFLRGNTAISAVEGIVDAMYMSIHSTPSESLTYAQGSASNPYPAKTGSLPAGGSGIDCGKNPFLEARKVKNVHHVSGRHFTWDTV